LPVVLPEGTVRCRRLQVAISVAAHTRCPYCFGSDADVRTRDHAQFCDFEEGRDPVCFGYPRM
jgi:hypothetical protein